MSFTGVFAGDQTSELATHCPPRSNKANSSVSVDTRRVAQEGKPLHWVPSGFPQMRLPRFSSEENPADPGQQREHACRLRNNDVDFLDNACADCARVVARQEPVLSVIRAPVGEPHAAYRETARQQAAGVVVSPDQRGFPTTTVAYVIGGRLLLRGRFQTGRSGT